MMIRRNKPTGAQYFTDGLFYKEGIHGFMYMYVGDNWVKSSKQKWEVLGGKVL